MGEVRITRRDAIENGKSNIYVGNFSIDKIEYKAGTKLTIVHHDTNHTEQEMTSHYIISGKVKYAYDGKEEVLGGGDAISFSACINEECLVQVMEDSVILSVTTNYEDKQLAILKNVIKKIDEKDHYTAKHCSKVTEYATAIALEYDKTLPINGISQAACVLDAGMIFVPERIIVKGEELNEDDVETIQKHPLSGGQMISQVFDDPIMARAVTEHHERLDGSGYPQGLKGDQICIEARILMVADMFDALTSTRGYRKAFSTDRAMEIIEKDAKAGRLDEGVVAAFKKCLAEGKVKV